MLRQRLLLTAIVAICAILLRGGSATATGVATVTSPDGLNLRSSPSTTAQVLAVIPIGSVVTLTGDPTADGWYPIGYASSSGWAFGAYLTQGEVSVGQAANAPALGSPGPVPAAPAAVASAAPAPASASSSFSAPALAGASAGGSGAPTVASTSAPASSGSAPAPQLLASMPSSSSGSSSAPQIKSAASNGAPSGPTTIAATATQGQNGSVSATTIVGLNAATGGTAALTMTVNTDALNLRTAPDMTSTVVTALPKGTSVQVIGTAVNNWLPVKLNANGLSGWMDQTFLAAAANLNTGASSTTATNSSLTLSAAAFGNPTLGTGAGPEAGLSVAVLPPLTPGQFVWPVTMRRITTTFKSIHQAVDIDQFPAGGNPAVATADGIVTYAGGDACCSYGLYVIVKHRDGFSSLYSHLSKVEVTQGQIIKQNQELGLTGNTGNSTGPHIHFAIYYQGLPFDPLQALPPGADIYQGA